MNFGGDPGLQHQKYFANSVLYTINIVDAEKVFSDDNFPGLFLDIWAVLFSPLAANIWCRYTKYAVSIFFIGVVLYGDCSGGFNAEKWHCPGP